MRAFILWQRAVPTLKVKESRMPEIVARASWAGCFEVLPRRCWTVERSLAWRGRCRRFAKDFAATIASAAAWIHAVPLRILTPRTQRLDTKQNLFESHS
jgi:transposase